ncbi:MAG: hypothetical protein SWZ49_21655 [Cyanobacteriota bacterium]|nr:hypothetical protein [Cyanobacteriota bacterium]
MMNKSIKQIIFWLPRILGILFAIFLSLFALDVFTEGYNFRETITALLMHLIPTFVVVIALIIAWRWEKIGSMVFAALGLFYLITSRGEGWIISGPMFVLGVLFLLTWIYRVPLRT